MDLPILLHQYFDLTAHRFPEKTALVCDQDRISYSSLFFHAEHLSDKLSDLGISKQDRIIIFLDNSPEIAIALYGILKTDAIFIVLNGSLKPKKLSYIINDSSAAILITHTNKASVVKDALNSVEHDMQLIWLGPENRIPLSLSNQSFHWNEILSGLNQNSSLGAPIFHIRSSKSIDLDLASLIYTSGSTGEPKGVMSSHRNMISAARSIITYLENTPDDITLNVLPLSFDYGLYQVIMSLIFGGTVVLEKSFQYMHSVLSKIATENVTGFPIVPTILAMILRMKDVHEYNIDSLRYISNTGAALPVEHIQKFRKLFPTVKVYSMYGLTECKRVSYMPPAEIDRKPDSVGKAMPNCEVNIVDENGKEVESGEIGELVIRGSNVMKGYWKAPELTAKYFRNDIIPGETVLYSGDLFRMDDDGYLYFVGRKDDMIKSRGERLSAREIENTIHEMNDISEVAVVGVPDEIFGQVIKAVIVAKPGTQISNNDVLAFCTRNMEPFAVPKYIEFVNELPRTPNGKIDKSLLL
ncbi:AMP-binding protein [candidate division KSB1 bacterium]|nr:AMP-binding protein [candidate division KSB1 bacterium]